jgi:hypothetical protein
VIAALAGVAKAGALLGIAVDLADERIDIDDQPSVSRSGARGPRPRKAVSEHPVELAHMPERKRAQEPAKRRGRRHPVPENRRRLPWRSTSQSSMQSAAHRPKRWIEAKRDRPIRYPRLPQQLGSVAR